MCNWNVSFSLSLPHPYDLPLIHRFQETHRAAIRVIQKMRYFVAKKKFQVRLTRFFLKNLPINSVLKAEILMQRFCRQVTLYLILSS